MTGDNAFDSQVGMERPRSPGEVLMEKKKRLRRADSERWGFSEGSPWVPIPESW